jgi:biopolymer transport protein ExbD
MGMSSRSGGPEINVTPLIDVLLVMLVIFIVIIPVMTKLETVELPPNEEGAVPEKPPVIVKLRADATATIDEDTSVMAVELVHRLKEKVSKGSTVFVDFEDGVPWGEVVGTVDGVRGLVADPESVRVAVRIRAEEN